MCCGKSLLFYHNLFYNLKLVSSSLICGFHENVRVLLPQCSWSRPMRPIPTMPPSVPTGFPTTRAAIQAAQRGRQMLTCPLFPTSCAAKYVNSIQEGTIHKLFHMETRFVRFRWENYLNETNTCEGLMLLTWYIKMDNWWQWTNQEFRKCLKMLQRKLKECENILGRYALTLKLTSLKKSISMQYNFELCHINLSIIFIDRLDNLGISITKLKYTYIPKSF